ncbi:hypothetical protein LCGC14_0267040 [marine sediment metagenome]|uniref:Uncharacterized protein n=1 Tax=marine sediment metagenome TaxID=412755 RepID=A0A0F9X4Q0_9ZZZZ
MNVWDDDFNLKLAISSIMDQVDEFIFLLGPYKYYPLFKDQNIYDINQETREMIYKLMGKKRFVIDNNMSQPWEREIDKRSRYFELLSDWTHPAGLALWAFVIDSDELYTGNNNNLRTLFKQDPKDYSFIGVPIFAKDQVHPADLRTPIRLFRIPEDDVLRYDGTHYEVYDKNGLCRSEVVFWDIKIYHLVGNRRQDRMYQQEYYYSQVVKNKLEKNALFHHLIRVNPEELEKRLK